MANSLAGLNARPKANYRKDTQWPEGKRQRLTRAVAKRLFDAISTSLDSLYGVLHANPDLPPHDQIYHWRRYVPWFSEGFREARKEQAEFLVQHCIGLAKDTNPKNAHSQRVKFDIYKWVAGKFSPDVYGDKPAQTAVNVAVGFNVSPERLNEIRGKLDITRDTLTAKRSSNGSHNRLLQDQSGDTHSEAETSNGIPETLPLRTESSTLGENGNNND